MEIKMIVFLPDLLNYMYMAYFISLECYFIFFGEESWYYIK